MTRDELIKELQACPTDCEVNVSIHYRDECETCGDSITVQTGDLAIHQVVNTPTITLVCDRK